MAGRSDLCDPTKHTGANPWFGPARLSCPAREHAGIYSRKSKQDFGVGLRSPVSWTSCFLQSTSPTKSVIVDAVNHWSYLKRTKPEGFDVLVFPRPPKEKSFPHFVVLPSTSFEEVLTAKPKGKIRRKGQPHIADACWNVMCNMNPSGPFLRHIGNRIGIAGFEVQQKHKKGPPTANERSRRAKQVGSGRHSRSHQY